MSQQHPLEPLNDDAPQVDPQGWAEKYFALLDEVCELRQAFHEALNLIEDLLEDPFIENRIGAFDSKIKRLSEWEDDWWELASPILYALGLPARLPAHLLRVKDRVERERSAQALQLLPERGVIEGL